MLLLITAAGAGSRFSKESITVPKPLIKAKGKSLLEHTLNSFNFNTIDQVCIAVQRAHEVPNLLNNHIQLMFPQINLEWIELDTLLPGQLSTAVAALEQTKADQNQPLLIHNCDTGFKWQDDLFPDNNVYGSMAVFEAKGNHWSFGQPDPLNPNRAIAIAEKRRISNLASIGLYGFKSGETFLSDAQRQLHSGVTVKGEHYIAPLLQQAISDGKTVHLPRVKGVCTYGTPEELCRSFELSFEELRANNR